MGSIPKSKLGEMRFPRGSNNDFDPTVKVSHMTKEEMDEYFKNRGGTKVAKVTKERYEELRKTGLNDSTIAKRCGVTQSALIYQKNKWYPEAKAESKEVVKPVLKVEPKEETKNVREAESQLRDLNNDLITENTNLKKQLEQSRVRVNQLEQLVNELTEVKEQLEAACENIESECSIERIRELEEVNQTLRQTLKVVL